MSGIKRRISFVHQKNVGIVGERAGKPDALLHAARKLVGIVILEPLEADPL